MLSSARYLIFGLLTLSLCCHAAQRQADAPPRAPSSELAKQNLSLVAASAAQIKAVLLQDPGLMVEVKRWVAKDATDHGQIIDESDLADDAIFDRIENDLAFRSVATEIVQQYGYLLPKVNPDSLMGKQQDLLLQERVKWIAQQDEEDRRQEHTRNSQDLQVGQQCSAEMQGGCLSQQSTTQPAQVGTQATRKPAGSISTPEEAPSETNPGAPPSPPSGNGGSLERAQLIEALGQSGSGLAMLGLSPLDTASLLPQAGRDGFTSGVLSLRGLATGGANLDPFTSSSMSGESGQSLSGGAPDSAEMSPGSGLNTVKPARPYRPPTIPSQQSSREAQQVASLEPRMVRASSPYNDIPSLYDMYLQAAPHPSEPRRFGSDVFRNGTRDPQLIPMDLLWQGLITSSGRETGSRSIYGAPCRSGCIKRSIVRAG